jgi:hypothetical protein
MMRGMDREERAIAVTRAALEQPLKAPSPRAPRRPIDDAQWSGGMIVEKPWDPRNVTVEQGRVLRYELEPCPRWMRPELYRQITDRVIATRRTGSLPKANRLVRWAARHVFEVREAPSLVSHDHQRSAIGAALEIAYRAKKAGTPFTELGLPIRRRVSTIWEEDGYVAAQLTRPADQLEGAGAEAVLHGGDPRSPRAT